MQQRTPEEHQILNKASENVRATLTAAGIPAHAVGESNNLADNRDLSGAIIYFSSDSNAPFGVFAFWRCAPETVSAAKAALLGSESTADTNARALIAATLDPMLQSLTSILESQGLPVGRIDIGGTDELLITPSE